MCCDCTSRPPFLAAQNCPNSAAAGNLERNAKPVELLAAPLDRIVRIASGAGNIQKSLERIGEVIQIDMKNRSLNTIKIS